LCLSVSSSWEVKNSGQETPILGGAVSVKFTVLCREVILLTFDVFVDVRIGRVDVGEVVCSRAFDRNVDVGAFGHEDGSETFLLDVETVQVVKFGVFVVLSR